MPSNHPPTPSQGRRKDTEEGIKYYNLPSPGVAIIALRYPIIRPLPRRRDDPRLPMPDKVVHGAPHELLVVQRKQQLHDAPELRPGLGARAPEEEAQAAELLLELLVPRQQQEAERAVVDGLRPVAAAADGSVGRLSFRWRHPGTLKITSSSGSALRMTLGALTTARITRASCSL
ncbi:hypothetical protein BC826DRAFT_1001715 [Russula brevipes]|nr:hypothetical protein BC826DRAFT_1001715 [Russula brevipes]